MKHQFKDNSSSETADLRSLIDFCYFDVSECCHGNKQNLIKGDLQKSCTRSGASLLGW